ncbi:MAG: hypothetical protein ACJA2U_000570 [Marinomonas primoryensis]
MFFTIQFYQFFNKGGVAERLETKNYNQQAR